MYSASQLVITMTQADHNEEVFLRDCIIWHETDPIFKDCRFRNRIVFGDPESTKKIKEEIDRHFAEQRKIQVTEQIRSLPRAQPCQARLSVGAGSTIVVKVNQYAR